MEVENEIESTITAAEELLKVEEVLQENEQPTSQNNISKIVTVETETKVFENKNIQLIEDIFGKYIDENGVYHNVKRFTWKNYNKIQVQVINYGARITSIKLPDRTGHVSDIVLGFDDVAGYLYNKKHYFGATIGRVTNVVKYSTFSLDGKQYWLTPNQKLHHFHGGKNGLDQQMWIPYVEGKKVIMSHISEDSSEGYPGALLLRVTFELSARNEFKISLEAQTTQPTIINLSNLMYFNLGGQHSGPDEIYKHIVTLNCNCYTQTEDGIPTGNIQNVIHTAFDFQIPKQLGKLMGIQPRDGYNQNFCINRGVDQGDCFVARILHPPSGRMLEVYSNQYGVHFLTGNDFGFGEIKSLRDILEQKPKEEVEAEPSELDKVLKMFNDVHLAMLDSFKEDNEKNFEEIINLIIKLKSREVTDDYNSGPQNTPVESKATSESEYQANKVMSDFTLTALQARYLKHILTYACREENKENCEEMKKIITNILACNIEQSNGSLTKDEKTESQIMLDAKKSQDSSLKRLQEEKRKGMMNQVNYIPSFYKNTSKIIGKGGAIYKMHGGIAFQTQNYPNAANISNFPSCELRPGEIYRHTITYKFWVRAGNPGKWIRRNNYENKHKAKGL